MSSADTGGDDQEPAPAAEWRLIGVGNLQPDPYHARAGRRHDDAFRELVESIRDDGMINDLLVRPIECSDTVDYDEDYLILDGVRRFRAVIGSGRSGDAIPCKVVRVDDETATRISLSTNRHYADLEDDRS